MTQYAIIKKLTGPDKAEVEVLRGTACGDDCGSFHLPFTLSALADYISADRSAMMRELRKMKEEHLVDIDRGQVTLHHALA